MESENALLLKSLLKAIQKLRQTPFHKITWKPNSYPENGTFASWLEFVAERLRQDTISVCDLEDLQTAFGGYGAWKWAFEKDEISQEIAGNSRGLFNRIVKRKGRQLLSAAVSQGILISDNIVELNALETVGRILGMSGRESSAILWSLSREGTSQWLVAYYKVSEEKQADPREDIELAGYQLTAEGWAALKSGQA